MKRYELIIEGPSKSYILDKDENKIIALCATKRPVGKCASCHLWNRKETKQPKEQVNKNTIKNR